MKIKNSFVFRHKVLFLSLLITFLTFYMILYGPFEYIRETWVTSALTTMKHDWLATMLYDKKTIADIKSKNYYVEPKDITDTSMINITKKDGKSVEVISIKGGSYTGYLMKIYDPSLVHLVTADLSEGKGYKVKDFVKKYDALGGMNCVSFSDEDGHSSGGVPDGFLMVGGKINHDTNKNVFHIIAITSENKLFLGDINRNELGKYKIRDAMEFGPYLVLNGKPTAFYGNGGAGLAPRTAIGQTADGTFLLLVIDGRQLATIGASLKDIQDIMIGYGAVNAANVDGGSSSLMYFEGKTVNCPINTLDGRYLPAALIIDKPADYSSNTNEKAVTSEKYSSVSSSASKASEK